MFGCQVPVIGASNFTNVRYWQARERRTLAAMLFTLYRTDISWQNDACMYLDDLSVKRKGDVYISSKLYDDTVLNT